MDRPNVEPNDIQIDGNVHWCPAPGAQLPKEFLEKTRASKSSEANKKNYPDGWEAHSFVADPKFTSFSTQGDAVNDYRLQADSPALGKGIALPAEWEDPLRPKDNAQPDIGALPKDAATLKVGIDGRIEAGVSGVMKK